MFQTAKVGDDSNFMSASKEARTASSWFNRDCARSASSVWNCTMAAASARKTEVWFAVRQTLVYAW